MLTLQSTVSVKTINDGTIGHKGLNSLRMLLTIEQPRLLIMCGHSSALSSKGSSNLHKSIQVLVKQQSSPVEVAIDDRVVLHSHTLGIGTTVLTTISLMTSQMAVKLC